jgi:hypothetical protein
MLKTPRPKNWEKRGLIYCPSGKHGWDKHTFLTPTPFLLNDDVIRIYGGVRDGDGVSRITYIDVAASNPSNILNIAIRPCLDIGVPGSFDDNGVILGSLLKEDDHLRLYYVGFQQVQKVKFLALSGLAVSEDGGETFVRIQNHPILDRFDDELHIRAIHTVRKESGKYRIWYSRSDSWVHINGVSYPAYNIRHVESDDGISPINSSRRDCVHTVENEYRIGRPIVWYEDSMYTMFYTKDTLNKVYSPGMAYSVDGLNWQRKDEDFRLGKSESGWDSEMVCYPHQLKAKGVNYLFYSGNNMGETGVGYAVSTT